MTESNEIARAPARKGRTGRPTAEGVRERDRIVVQVAMEVFVESGYSRASLDRIASRAGVAKRTLYEVYGGKPGLFTRVMEPWVGGMPDPREFDHCGSARDVLLSLVRATLLDDGRRGFVLTRILVEEGRLHHETMSALQRQSRRGLVAHYQKIFAYLVGRRMIPADADTARLATLFVDLVISSVLIAGLTTALEDNPRLVEDGIDVLLCAAGCWAGGRACPEG